MNACMRPRTGGGRGQLVVRRPDEELGDEQVNLGDFDMMALFKTAFEAEGVPEAFREKMIERYQCQRTAQ